MGVYKTLDDAVDDLWERVKPVAGQFPPAAFAFVSAGLAHTVRNIHGDNGDAMEMLTPPSPDEAQDGELNYHASNERGDHASGERSESSRHVNGQQLCLGLRDYAIKRYGKLARTVLRQMNIHETQDFGRIVFAMVDAKQMSKSQGDKFEDFSAVFSFSEAFGE